MCFNGPKYYQAGWLSDRHIDLINGDGWDGKVYGVATYENSSVGDAIVIRISSSPNIYLSYNLASGINSGVQEGSNKVMVHTKNASPSAYELSFTQAKLSVGGSVTLSGNTIQFLSTGDGYAMVQINDGSPVVTSSPTTAPTPNTPSCDDITKRSTCLETSGCSWESDGAGGGICKPYVFSCGDLTKRKPCIESDGCFWKSDGNMVGRCKECTGINRKNQCTRKGCLWMDNSCM